MSEHEKQESRGHSDGEKEGPAVVETISSDMTPSSAHPDHKVYRPQDELHLMHDTDIEKIHRMAQDIRTTAAGPSRIVPTADSDPTLDPESEAFNAVKWMKNFVKEFADKGINNRGSGMAFRNLDVYSSGSSLKTQETVASYLAAPLRLGELFSPRRAEPKRILHDFEGLVQPNEMLLVLGRPGSGCSTLLKTLTGRDGGLKTGEQSVIHFDGIPLALAQKEFRGEIIYNDDADAHYPHLNVYQTVEFAAALRVHDRFVAGENRSEVIRCVTLVILAMLGLTSVSNDPVHGISDGERKRVSVAEMFVSGSPVAAWDKSTRCLDSATALRLVKALRLVSDISELTNIVSIYKASQAIYDNFDKVTVLYEGRQIYFGSAALARSYFENLGWYCPPRQSTAEFLTSVTSPTDRQPREGFQRKVPRTPEEFVKRWKESDEYQVLKRELDEYEQRYLGDQQQATTIAERNEQKHSRQAKHVKQTSPYTVSIAEQIRLNAIRQYRSLCNTRFRGIVSNAVVDFVVALVGGSVFFNTPDATSGFLSKGSAIFLVTLLNALAPMGEFPSLWATRPVVRKHASYALYHPGTEALAGLLLDLPIKFLTAAIVNPTAYFMVGLRATASQFFLFFLVLYTATFIMASAIRTVAILILPVNQAMGIPANLMVLTVFMFSGFTLTVPNMPPWFSWIRWLNPLYYAFEILIANEFHGREFECSRAVPPYAPPGEENFICDIPGAVAGRATVSGDDFIMAQYRYSYSHVWRNYGILLGFLVGMMAIGLFLIEFAPSPPSKAGALVFRRGRIPASGKKGVEAGKADEDVAPSQVMEWVRRDSSIQPLSPQEAIFTWRDVVYDVQSNGTHSLRLIEQASGWIKPGTLTAIMGASGAGKTTLLDVLTKKTDVGVVSGEMLLGGKILGADFQRSIGYVQHEDVQLETATVRETLQVSAMLRQPNSISKPEKYAFVENIIKMLGMEDLCAAIVGTPGAGLNLEQRRLLSIGVELATRPKLLFLDDPTNGLDSQASRSICRLLRRLADSGQAVLCSLHQPSADLFETFDKLLFLSRGGKTIYFGDIGPDSSVVMDYFKLKTSSGAHDNPADLLLDKVTRDKDTWPSVWNKSKERQTVLAEIDNLNREAIAGADVAEQVIDSRTEFAMPFWAQLWVVTHRLFQQYWRSPGYVLSKLASCIIPGLYIGFSFYDAEPSVAGVQNVSFALVMVTVVVTGHAMAMQPFFLTQRDLYERRERPGKAYSWAVFMVSNILVEIPYQVLSGLLVWACFYYPVVGIQSSERQGLILLFVIQLYIYASTVAHMCIAAIPDDRTGSALVRLVFITVTVFAGVLQLPDALPGFWMWMYRLSPFTYWIGGITATALAGREVQCSAAEMLVFNPPSDTTCGDYLAPMLEEAPGYLDNPSAMVQCRYCTFTVTDQFLAGPRMFWSERWRDFGLIWAYVVFNMAVAVLSYYFVRVRRWRRPAWLKRLLGD